MKQVHKIAHTIKMNNIDVLNQLNIRNAVLNLLNIRKYNFKSNKYKEMQF